jgi:membrane protein YqaA with SNARE-associated domain
MSDTENPEEEVEVELNLKRILVFMVITLVAFIGLVGFLAHHYREPLFDFGKSFVEHLGGFGVTLGFLLPDALTLPIPADAVSVVGRTGGLTFINVVLFASVGSLTGGSLGYVIGRKFGGTSWFKRLTKKKGREMESLMRRYGVKTLFIAVVTPLPYSLGCWAAGALKMPFKRFFLISLFRIPRIALYLFLIEPGNLPGAM